MRHDQVDRMWRAAVHAGRALAVLVLVAGFAPATSADAIVKANNTIPLNQAASWVTNGPPGAADVAQWDGTVTVANTYALGDSLQHWQGLSVTGAIGGNVILAGGQTLTLGSAGLRHDPTTAARLLTVNCGVALGSSQTWTITGGRSATISGDLSGTADLTKDGGGTLTLSGSTNSFSGEVRLNQGILVVSADGNLGAPGNALNVTGPAQLTANGFVTARNIDIATGATLTNSVSVLLTVNGTISGAGTLRKADTGVLVLNGTNTHGATVIAAGELRANEGVGMSGGTLTILGGGIWASSVDITRALGTGAGQVQLAGDAGFSAYGAPMAVDLGGAGGSINWGVAPFGNPTPFYLNNLNANAKLTFRNSINLNGNPGSISVVANLAEISGIISNGTGTAGLTKSGGGVLWLTATNTFNGTLTVNGAGGALRARDGVGIPSGVNVSLSQDGVWASDEDIVRPVGSGAGNVQLVGAGGGDGFSASGAPIHVNLGGAGAALSWGTATFTPPALILNGTSADHPITFENALDLNGGARTVKVDSTNVPGIIAGVISHHSSTSMLTKSGAGVLVLAATNTWSHSQSWGTNLNVVAGTVVIEREENLGGTPAPFQARSLLLNGGTLRTTSSTRIDDASRGLTLGLNDGTFEVPEGLVLTLATPIAGTTGDLIKTGRGTLVLANAGNAYGTTTVGTRLLAGALEIREDGNLGTASADLYVMGDSTLFSAATATLNSGRAVILNTNWTVVVTNGAVLTIAGPINESLGNAGALTKAGAGTLVLSGNNDWNAATVLAEGVLAFGAANALPDTAGGDVMIAPGTTLDLSGYSGSICSITGAGTIDNSAPGTTNTLSVGVNGTSTVFAGVIRNTGGTMALTKVGTGTLTLSEAQAYSGATTVTLGTLKLGAAEVIPNGGGRGNVTVTGVLDLNGFDETLNGLSGAGSVTNSGAAAVTLTVGDGDGTGSFSGVIGGGGQIALVKAGAGTQTLSGINTYGGDTTVSAGKLELAGAAAIPSGAGRGNVSVAGGATLDINQNVTLNGLSGAGRVDNDAATVRVLAVGGNDQTCVFSGTITNSGGVASLGLTKTGAGTLTLTGGNGYGGVTTITGGTLSIGDGGASGTLGTGNTTDNGTLLFDREGVMAYNGVISGTGRVLKRGAGTVSLGGASSYAGGTGVEAGMLTVSGAQTAAATGTNVISGGTLRLGGDNRLANAAPVVVSGGTLDIQTFNDAVSNVTLIAGSIMGTGGTLTGTVYFVESGTISARLGGAAALIKSSEGSVTLASASGYTAGTVVHGGALRVTNATGSGTGTGAVTVNAGGRFGGTGRVAGGVIVNAGGSVDPGMGVGTLTAGGLLLQGGSAVAFEFNVLTGHDQIVVTNLNGFVIQGGAFSLYEDGTTNAWTQDGTYDLIQFTGSLGGAGPGALAVANPAPGKAYAFSTAGGWLRITMSSEALLSIGDASVVEGDEGTTNLSFTVSITATNAVDVSAEFSTADSTARADFGDYAATQAVVTIPAGSLSTQLVIEVLGDTKHETNETLTVTLSNPTHAILFAAAGTGTIMDNDPRQGRWYVNDNASGTGNGFNWDDAFTSVQSGLASVVSGEDLWVAAGTYTPGVNRADTFQLKSGVTLYGGFAGGEVSAGQRNWMANATLLSGDIGVPGVATDNSEHIVTGENNSGLDGFTIAHAYSSGNGGGMQINQKGPITLRHITFTNNFATGSGARPGGGAIYFSSAAATGMLTIDQCAFQDNATAANGGAILVFGMAGNMRVDNSLFLYNRRGLSWGGDIANTSGSLSSVGLIVNCTFVNPEFESIAAGILGLDPNPAHLKLVNCILWKDGVGTNMVGRVMNHAQISVDTCLIDGAWDISPTTGGTISSAGTVITNDPQFADLPARDLRVRNTSPAIDAGVANTIPVIAMPTVDFLGHARPAGVAFDLGAYEGGVALVPPSGGLILVY
ncbi:MAG: autotransporter-associated beta strand repeat-containing protein [Lentisphaerae bacterium]|nr:autotransporter-associated beta strand repeat-containing protein [Lentisphaerota bacterium]